MQYENKICRSKFVSCITNNDGGAIFTSVNLSINFCMFIGNAAYQGSCIYSQSDFYILRSSMYNCEAKKSGTIFSSNFQPSKFNFTLTCIQGCYSTSYCALFRQNSENTTLNGNNATNCYAKERVGGFGIVGSQAIVKYSVIIDSRAKEHVSYLLSDCKSSSFYYSTFFAIQPFASAPGTSVCIGFYSPNSQCSVNHMFYGPLAPTNQVAFSCGPDCSISIANLHTTVSPQEITSTNCYFVNNVDFLVPVQHAYTFKTHAFIGYTEIVNISIYERIFTTSCDVMAIFTMFVSATLMGGLFSVILSNQLESLINSLKYILAEPKKSKKRNPNPRKISSRNIL